MLELLKKYDYVPPHIVAGTYGRMEVSKNGNGFYLTVDGNQWMAYNTFTHEEAFDVFSHYYLARGHVLVTGLGFGAREGWLLTKPEVTKLTIVEKNKEVIEYHEKNGSSFLQDDRVEIVLSSAQDYRGKCDVLLADHYEFEDHVHIMNEMEVLQKNIDCELLWFWPLERIIMYSRKWHSDNDYPYRLITKYEAFNLLKQNHRLHKLPDISEETLNMFCMMHNSKMFSKSEYVLESTFPDRNVFDQLYKSI